MHIAANFIGVNTSIETQLKNSVFAKYAKNSRIGVAANKSILILNAQEFERAIYIFKPLLEKCKHRKKKKLSKVYILKKSLLRL